MHRIKVKGPPCLKTKIRPHSMAIPVVALVSTTSRVSVARIATTNQDSILTRYVVLLSSFLPSINSESVQI